MEFQLLKPEVIQKLLDFRIHPKETNQWTGEAAELEDDKIDDRKKLKKCYILVTEVCFYVVSKESFKTGSGVAKNSYFDLCDINVKHSDNIITLKFKAKTYYFMLPNCPALLTNIFLQIKKIAWNITPGQIISLNSILNMPEFQRLPSIQKRPDNLLLLRYLSACVAKEVSPEPYLLTVYSQYDEEPRRNMRLVDWELNQPPLPAMFPLSLEPFIQNVTFEKFAPNSFGTVLNWVISNQNKISSVDLYKYDNANFKGLNMKRSAFNHCGIVRIRSCTSSFVSSFLNAIKSVNFSINTLIFNDIKFDVQTSELLVQCLQTYTFFSSLTSLAFVGCQSINSSFFDLAVQCLKAREVLDNYTLDNCFIDICDVLMEIAKSNTPVQHVSLRRNTATSVIGHEDTLLPSNILSVNVGDSEWTEEAFTSFISAICRRLRRLPLTLMIDHCRIDSTWSEVFERFPMESLLPVITELNISSNYFDDRAFDIFLSFLETQSPFLSQSKTKLTHLNVSHCFKENSNVCMEKLLNFFSKRELWGLEICGAQPIAELINIQGLHALNIGDNEFDRQAIEVLEAFVANSATLTELGINNIKFPDVKVMMQFYSQMFTHSKILAFDRLTTLFTQYPEYNETKRFKDFLTNKRVMSTPRQRISLFLALAEDFATHVANDIKFSEEDENVKEGCRQSTILCEINFSDPVPSLFTLATLNAVDVSVDPVASMVTEYVATSGRYGIVPPTAPPPIAPDTEFLLPSIYSTMTTRNEVAHENEYADFDPKSKENIEVSKMLMGELKKNLTKNGAGDSKDDWAKTKIFKSFKPMLMPGQLQPNTSPKTIPRSASSSSSSSEENFSNSNS